MSVCSKTIHILLIQLLVFTNFCYGISLSSVFAVKITDVDPNSLSHEKLIGAFIKAQKIIKREKKAKQNRMLIYKKQ